ncbi:MAG: hypothetical protein Q9195_005310 [Heterodermia aff. obscurata]
MIYSYIKPIIRIDRIQEYTFLKCQELLSQAVSYRLKDRTFAQIVQQLDEEKEAYEQWQEEQAHIKILMGLKPERPTWLYATPHRTMPGTRRLNLQTQNELLRLWRANAMPNDPDTDEIIGQIRKCAQYERDSSAMKGGLRQLLAEKRYDELWRRIQRDEMNLCCMPYDGFQKYLYRDSIAHFQHNHFKMPTTEEFDKPETWGRPWQYRKREVASPKALARFLRKMIREARSPSCEFNPWLV